ncbi:GNAT family N-acetyltransferase [Actinokineospora pegani]|uniref:GNAT family N-acetyltransferase n=1 Tax=Actinokineospora pegani TaxID=2654637 RepID=UPI0012EA3CE4|nr:GNAT family protein [Actinokineospora pegani]
MAPIEFPIKTRRLVLRPYAPGDLDFLVDLHGRADVVEYLLFDVRDRDEVAEALRQRLGQTSIEGGKVTLAITVDGTVVGDVVLMHASVEHRTAEVGWVLHPDHHGHGYATEAATALVDLAFEDLGMHRVIARLDAENTASVAVCERLGLRREAHFRQSEFIKGRWADEVVYAVLADEWVTR